MITTALAFMHVLLYIIHSLHADDRKCKLMYMYTHHIVITIALAFMHACTLVHYALAACWRSKVQAIKKKLHHLGPIIAQILKTYVTPQLSNVLRIQTGDQSTLRHAEGHGKKSQGIVGSFLFRLQTLSLFFAWPWDGLNDFYPSPSKVCLIFVCWGVC